ncbi:hypothetical protein ACF0H5_009809 [Mactra antiquata]
MVFIWAFALMVIAVANGMDETKLWRLPPPMKGFQWEKALGRWYYQFRKAPCSWSGSNELTDYEMFISKRSKNSLWFALTMRNGVCNTINHSPIIVSPGVHTTKDPTGGGFSGVYVQVAGDYKTFMIVYGCTKMSVFGDKCDDASITVSTRMRFPDKKVISMINDALMQLWRITVNDLQRVKHIQPCFQNKPPVQLNQKWW